ncbi:hypothetical protein LTR85_004730 [Meristemomyces frigidus]|nr:hypothetical protein LTR85_004730 [Meristemomyces frigidus]
MVTPRDFHDAGAVTEYTAVSYTWKEPDHYWYDVSTEKFAVFEVNSRLLPVAGKLAYVLKALYQLGVRSAWVDALCINQSDLAERGHQVERMREIYSSAQRVIIFLGTPSIYTDAFFKYVADASCAVKGMSLAERFGLIEVLEHPYWTRAWDIQEIAEAHNIDILCGEQLVSWATFMRIFDLGEIKELLVNDRLHSQSPIQQIRAINGFREGPRMPLLQTLISTRSAQATDPRDGVYAKLGLASDAAMLFPEPDHTLSAEQVAQMFAVRYLTTKRDIYLICLAEESWLKVPSWVPD